MWREVTSIPNKPAMFVSVEFRRSMEMTFGPNRGKCIDVVTRFVGSSAGEVPVDEARKLKEVVWRFIQGQVSGGDDLERSPAWNEKRIVVPLTETDALKAIAMGLSLVPSKCRWFVAAD